MEETSSPSFKPGDRVWVRRMGPGTVLEADSIESADHVAVEIDSGGAGFVPVRWVRELKS